MITSQSWFELLPFFSRSVFPTILEPRGTGLFRHLEFWVSCGTKNTHNILATYLFARAFVPSKSKFLPLFHALTVCDTTSFSAGHEIAKIVNMDFCKFVSYWRKYCCYRRPWNKIQWNLDITNLFVTTSSAWRPIFLYPSNSKQYEKEPRYNETSLYLL